MLIRNLLPVFFLSLFMASCHSDPPAPTGGKSDPPTEYTEAERSFSVLVYNVENLFDLDGIALFDDYRPVSEEYPQGYSHRHFHTKLRNIVETVRSIDGGKGPDIILFQEFEGDQTPGMVEGHDIMKEVASLSYRPPVEKLLAGEGALTDFWQTLPAYAWVALALQDAGLPYPHIVSADYQPPASADEGPVHANAVFSRFPITRTASHPLMKARSILEAEIQIDGHTLIVLNNHWKSGAGSAEREVIRIQNASVLRDRLDEILKENPLQDVLLAGDFNSHYNQRWLFPDWPRTGINDVLGSQGDETALMEEGSPDLYNLWYELPFKERGSELYQGYWGTLMQILVTPGLYDRSGIQYIDQSFRVIKLPGKNVEPVRGAPFRWIAAGEGAGFSDHFPIMARFKTLPSPQEGFVQLDRPSRVRKGPDQQPEGEFISTDLSRAVELKTFGNLEAFSQARNIGTLVKVKGVVRDGRRVMLETGLGPIELWIPDPDYRQRFKQAYGEGEHEVELIGLVGWYRGRWQIELAHPSWGPSI
jgi:hypothetical protein